MINHISGISDSVSGRLKLSKRLTEFTCLDPFVILSDFLNALKLLTNYKVIYT